MPKKRLRIVRVRRRISSTAVVLGAGAVLATAFVVMQAVAANPTQRYINPATGTDTGQCADIVLPCKTFQYAASVAAAGDILNVRGGTYQATSTTTFTVHDIPGSSTDRTVLQPYPGETVVLDGTGVAFSDTQALLQLSNVDNFEVVGFEIRNSRGRGIAFAEAQNVRIANNKVHDIYFRAIGGWADGAVIENNEVWNSSLSNQGNACLPSCTGGWPGVIQTASRYGSGPPQEAAKNIVIRGNYVHDNWGEGILPNFADGIQILNNIVANNYSVNIYLSHTRNATVDGNYLYVSSDVFNKTGRHANGITFASESSSNTTPKFKSENFRITNNIIAGTAKGINYWSSPLVDPANSYSNITILHNTFSTTSLMPLQADAVVNGDPPGPVAVKNNIIATGGNGGYSIGDLSVWSFQNNMWTPAKPTTSYFTSDYEMADVPYVSPVTGGDAHGFGLVGQLPYLGISANITVDYFGSPRSLTSPTIGAVEYGSASTPMPTNTPTIAPTATPTPEATPTPAAGDTTPPAVTVISPVDGSILPKSGTVSVKVSASDTSGIASITIYVDGAQKTQCTGSTNCSYSLNVSKLTVGSHTIRITAVDKSVNKNSGTAAITVYKNAAAATGR